MPVKKGVKRAALAESPVGKRNKGADPAIAHISDAISQATDVSEPCRRMLLAAMSGAFATPRDDRHPVQQKLVEMIGEVVESVQVQLRTALELETSKVAEVEAHRTRLQQEVQSAEERLVVAAADVESKSEALAQATEGDLSAKGMLQDKQKVQRTGDEELVKAKENKSSLERGIECDLRAILEGTAENPNEHYTALLPLLEDLALDESLMSALPNVCSKKATDRGSFDTMVLEQLAQSLRDRISSLAKVVDDALPAAEARAAAVQTAQDAVEAASVAQAVAHNALNTANAAKQAAEAAVASAHAAVAAFEPEYEQATSARDACKKSLEDFKTSNVGSFELLRDKESAPSATVGGA